MPRLPKTDPAPVDTTNAVDTILLPAQLAELLRTSEASLAQRRSRGNGPRFIKLGSRVLYRLSDVHEWLDANTVTRTGEQLALFDERPAERRSLSPSPPSKKWLPRLRPGPGDHQPERKGDPHGTGTR
jgi:predicted DNA-binding transcriptional regulator AlpA